MQTSSGLLLDTHVWIWLMKGDEPRLKGSPALDAMIAAARSSSLFISAVSVWEVAMLEAKGRIVLGSEAHDWIETALSAPGTTLIPILPKLAVDSTRLPGDFDGDPADRILVACARHLRCPLVTADRRILDYAQFGYVQTLTI